MATVGLESFRAVHRGAPGGRGFSPLSFVLPQSSSSARCAFDRVRARIRDLHTETNLAARECDRDQIAATAERMVAT